VYIIYCFLNDAANMSDHMTSNYKIISK